MLYAVEVQGKYKTKQTNRICILLEAKSENEAIRNAQDIFLAKFPDDFITENLCLKITYDATKSNPSARSPIEVSSNEPKGI
jgi:hypothetical protein